MSLPLNVHTQTTQITGPTGLLECAYDQPDTDALKGVAVIAHPHPLHSGTMDNKVVHTLARALLKLGYVTWRFNFRGVAESEGKWDHGVGEVDDMLTVIKHVRDSMGATEYPLVLGGFSFGAYIAAQATQHLLKNNIPIQHLVLVGAAASLYEMPSVPDNTLLIHGEADEFIPIQSILNWAKAQQKSVTIVPEAGHFFHGKLLVLQDIILEHWRTSVE